MFCSKVMKHDGLSYLAGPRLSNWCEFRALNGNLKIEADSFEP